MELTVYRQSSKTRPDGTVVYKGEDALPYVDDSLIMAADGLGGAAAIRHQKIAPELFDADKVVDKLFSGVYNDYNNDTLIKYVTDSFFELFAVKDCYTDNVNNIKKSGYFASRIVTAIVLHDFLTNPVFKPEVFFDALAKEENEDERKKALDRLGAYFAEKIRADLRKIAENANLVYESSYSGMALLGTTLTATYYHELKDCVEAIYITAGDSRPYMWSEKEGLCQLVADEEGPDGGMTNYIKANDDDEDETDDFTISCKYMRFDKPCVLFNASDGCFDSAYFVGPMAFERLILEQAGTCASTEELSRKLTDFFAEYGRHDDSSTIAMKFFGYRDFSDFRNAAQKRLSVINSRYISQLPDILENDYISEFEKNTGEAGKRLDAIRVNLSENPAVQAYCARMVHDDVVSRVLAEGSDELKAAAAKAEESAAAVRDVVRGSFAEFLVLAPEEEGFDVKSAEEIVEIGKGCRVQSESYIKQLEQHKAAVDETSKQLSSIIAELSGVGVPKSLEDYEAVAFTELKGCEAAMNSTLGFLDSIRAGKNNVVNTMLQRKEEYQDRNQRLAEKNEKELRRFCDLLIGGRIKTDDAAAEKLKGVIEPAMADHAALDKLEGAAVAELSAKAAAEYWETNGRKIISGIAAGDTAGLPGMLVDMAEAALKATESSASELEKKAMLQKKLFADYDKLYSRYMRGDEE